MVVFWQGGCIWAKVVVCGQKRFYSEKVAVLGLKWLYSVKIECIRENWLYSVKSCCVRAKVVVLGQGGSIRAR